MTTNDPSMILTGRVHVVCRDRRGNVCRTARGARSWHVALEQADGRLYVQKLDHGGRMMAATAAAKVLRAIESGAIRLELMRWDDDEHDMYAPLAVAVAS